MYQRSLLARNEELPFLLQRRRRCVTALPDTPSPKEDSEEEDDSFIDSEEGEARTDGGELFGLLEQSPLESHAVRKGANSLGRMERWEKALLSVSGLLCRGDWSPAEQHPQGRAAAAPRRV